MGLAHGLFRRPAVALLVKRIRHFLANFAEADFRACLLVVHPQAPAIRPGLAGQDPDGSKSGKAGKGATTAPALDFPTKYSIRAMMESLPNTFSKSNPCVLAI